MTKIIFLNPLFKVICVCLIIFVFSNDIKAQSLSLQGSVFDENNNPLIGAVVAVNGDENATITDMDGKFKLENVKSGSQLVISYLGYKSKTISIKGQKNINIILEEDSKVLDDVVVVGYGSQKKETLTGSISVIKGETITTTKNSSLAQGLQGKISGLEIRQQDGQPGSFNSMIRVRGMGAPVFVIDGVVRDSGDGGEEFQRLNAEDIESISILKDGAAAIYGMNAASGAIIVTTKKGKKGKLQISYDNNIKLVYPTSMLKVMNAGQYMEVMNEFSMNNGTGPFTTPEELEKWRAGGPGYESTDWLGAIFKNNTLSQQHNFSIQGGNDKITFFTSAGYVNDGDLTKGGDYNYERYNFRNNLSANFDNGFSLDVSLSGRYDVSSSPISSIFDLLFQSTINKPTTPIYSNNDPNYYNYAAPFNDNAVAKMYGDITGKAITRTRSLLSNVKLRYDFKAIDGLYTQLLLSYDARDSRTTHERKKYSLYVYDSEKQISHIMQNPSNLYVSVENGNRLNLQYEIGYNKSFNQEHNLKLMGLYELTRNWNDWTNAYREYDIYYKPILDQGSENNMRNGGGYGETANISYLGRINYDYKGKYLLEAAFRINGSYRYAPDKRWGFFPVASIGWRMSEENFIKDNLSFVSNLKLRASYGSTGIDAGDEFQYIEGFTLSNSGYEFSNGYYTKGVNMPGLINKNLTWMKATTLDLGLDLNLWNGKLDFTFDVFQRTLSGIPASPQTVLTNTFGIGLPQENLDEDLTQGFDFSIGHSNNINDFYYSVQGNLSFARTKDIITQQGDFNSSWDIWRGRNSNRWAGTGWGYKTEGQFTNFDQIYSAPIQTGSVGNTQVFPGDYYLEDTNGDGYIDGNDLMPMYYSVDMPALNFGFNFSASYKGFDFYALFQGSSCYSLRIPDNLRNYAPWDGNSMEYLYDRWHRKDPFDPNSEWIPGKYPTARHMNYAPMGNQASETDRNTVDATYLRLKTLELGYTIPKYITQKVFINKMRIFINAYNIFTLYNPFLKNELKVDPEKNTGQDGRMMNYPLSRTVSFGLNITF